MAIADVVGPKETKNYDNLKISDEDIDKLFNSNCGYFEEIKKPMSSSNQPAVEHNPQQSTKIVQKEALENTSEENKKKLETIQDNNNKNNDNKKADNSKVALNNLQKKTQVIGDCKEQQTSEIVAKKVCNEKLYRHIF